MVSFHKCMCNSAKRIFFKKVSKFKFHQKPYDKKGNFNIRDIYSKGSRSITEMKLNLRNV